MVGFPYNATAKHFEAFRVPILTILPSVPVWGERGRYVFDKKFFDGVAEYKRYWPGSIRLVMSLAANDPPVFGTKILSASELPVELRIIDSGAQIGMEELEASTAILASGDSFNQFHVSSIARQIGAVCVYSIENTLKTRLDIMRLETAGAARKIWRSFYLYRNERRRLRAFALADGLQANGVPAFESYRAFKDNMLYFDTRVRTRDIASKDDINQRSVCQEARPIRLAFSGRLTAIKGVADLPYVAKYLNNMHVPFRLAIYGDGDLYNELDMRIRALNVQQFVELKGAVDFESALMPTLKSGCDLFVMPHLQGDPSCTYLETLSCGVPIVGYGNAAFKGLLATADVGWQVDVGDCHQMARVIRDLAFQRERIRSKAYNAADFARENDFSCTFRRRIEHLLGLVKHKSASANRCERAAG